MLILAAILVFATGMLFYHIGGEASNNKYNKLKSKYDHLVEAVTDGKGLPVQEVEKIVEKRVEVPVEKIKNVMKYKYPETCGIGECKGRRHMYCTAGSCAKHHQMYCSLACPC